MSHCSSKASNSSDTAPPTAHSLRSLCQNFYTHHHVPLRQRIERLEERVHDNNRLGPLKQHLESFDERLKSQDERLERQSERLDRAQAKVQSLRGDVDRLREAVDRLKADRDTSRGKVNQYLRLKEAQEARRERNGFDEFGDRLPRIDGKRNGSQVADSREEVNGQESEVDGVCDCGRRGGVRGNGEGCGCSISPVNANEGVSRTSESARALSSGHESGDVHAAVEEAESRATRRGEAS